MLSVERIGRDSEEDKVKCFHHQHQNGTVRGAPEDIRRRSGIETDDVTLPILPGAPGLRRHEGALFGIIRPERTVLDRVISGPINSRQRSAPNVIDARHNLGQGESTDLQTINQAKI